MIWPLCCRPNSDSKHLILNK
uniref:Uncharacterized protein n=1 Tax=Arundo donax TaxID=35708 RepID=A0A0A9GMU8_ARUDO